MAKILNIVKEQAGDRPILHDVPLLLRSLADRVEGGEFGDLSDPDLILRLSIVLRASGMDVIVFGMGKDNHTERTYMDLHAGAQQLMNMRHPERT